MMADYYFTDFDNYSKILRDHALHAAECMKIIDDEIISMGLPPVGRTRDLFRIFTELKCDADYTYKEQNNITEESFRLTTYMSDKEVLDNMRSAFREEFNCYKGDDNGNQE